jgi:uncharacterized integral membrane protein
LWDGWRVIAPGSAGQNDPEAKTLARKIAAALILVPLAIVLIGFAVANRQTVTVSIDPFNANDAAASLKLPLFAVMIGLLIFGVIVGGVAAWLRQGKWRRTARQLQREAQELRTKITAYETSGEGAGITPAEHHPPQRPRLEPPEQ